MTSPQESPAPRRLRVAAGVLHYRSWPAVRQPLEDLFAQTRRPDEVLLLDHASGDGSLDEIRRAYPDLEVVEAPDNRGPAVGMNRLMQALMARDVDAFFVVPDDMQMAPDVLEKLAARLEADPELGAVGPLVAHQREPELIFYAGGYVDKRTWDLEFRDVPKRVDEWTGRPPQQVEFLELAAILARVEAVKSAGMLPELYYYLYDDVEFTLRIAAKGWGLECVPEAVVWQDLGPPTRTTLVVEMPPYLAVRNRLGLIARNAPRRMLVRELLRTLSWLVRDAIHPRTGSRANLVPRVRGLFDFLRGRWGAPPETS